MISKQTYDNIIVGLGASLCFFSGLVGIFNEDFSQQVIGWIMVSIGLLCAGAYTYFSIKTKK